MILRELLVKLGLDFHHGDFDKAEEKLGSLKKAAGALVVALAGHKLFEEVKQIVGETTEAAHQLGRLALTFGVSPEQLQAMSAMAGGTDELRMALTRLSVHANAAKHGSKESAAAFKQLGISATDASGHVKPAGVLFGEVSDAFTRMKNPAERAALAVQLFGRDGGRLVPILMKGSEGLAAYQADVEHLGATISEDFVQDSEKYQKELKRQKLAIFGIEMAITKAVLPAFQWLAHAFTEGIAAVTRFLSGTQYLRAIFIALAAAAVVLAVAMISPFLPFIGMVLLAAAGILLLIAIVEDLWFLLTGGNSLIGRLADRWAAFVSEFTNPENVKAGESAWLTSLRVVVGMFGDLQGAITTAVDFYVRKITEAFDWVKNKAKAAAKVVTDLLPESWTNGGEVGVSMGSAPATGPQELGPTPGKGVSVVNQPQFNMEIAVNGAGDPNAVAVEVGRQVDERLSAHASDLYMALTPAIQ